MESLIYDRTQSDVDGKTSKGYHNVSDLNRIEVACRELADLLTSYGYTVQISTKTDWAITDIRYEGEIERIRQNIGRIKDAYYSFKTTPELPETLNRIDIQKANDIEKILYDIDLLIKNMEASFLFCGTFNAGESEGLI